MPSLMSVDDSRIIKTLKSFGYIQNTKIVNTLQGSIWRSYEPSTNSNVVIKVTNRYLHKHQMIIVNKHAYRSSAHENIEKEALILYKLSEDKQCPNSVTKYVDSFKSKRYYMVVMEDGGRSLFDFVLKAHRFIQKGILDIVEWHKMCKLIFKQMLECLEYIHSQNVCHLDISLENFLINDVEILLATDGKMRFVVHNLQIKVCDFGLAEIFPDARYMTNKYCGKKNYKSPEISSQQSFCAKSNDIWCLGVSLFMMIVGSSPWKQTSPNDERFVNIMNGNIVELLAKWNRLPYIDSDIVELFTLFFQYEKQRVQMDKLKQCKWLNG